MSLNLFGISDDEDNIFGGMRQMSRMMNSMINQQFGGFLEPPMGSQLMPFGSRPMLGGMMPFGFPSMGSLFPNMDQMTNNPNCHSFSSSTVMTMTNGPDGRPQVYQASSSVRQGPGGVKETKKAVSDSASGVKKLAIGHHIGDRAHIVEREQNYHTGDREERQEYINLDEDDAEEFNQEWSQKTRSYNSRAAINYPSAGRHGNRRRHQGLPALPSSSSPCDNSETSPDKSRKRHLSSSENEDSETEHSPKTQKKSTVENHPKALKESNEED